MGSKNAFAYLASPAVVAASAAKGYIAVCDDDPTYTTDSGLNAIRRGGAGPARVRGLRCIAESVGGWPRPSTGRGRGMFRLQGDMPCDRLCGSVTCFWGPCRPASRSLTGFRPRCMEAFSSVGKTISTQMASIRYVARDSPQGLLSSRMLRLLRAVKRENTPIAKT